MGTWDTGPFDNDTAADFAIALDNANPEEREVLIRGVLARTVNATGYLAEAEEAVAAAALIAVQCPGGEPIDTAYGPEKAMPAFPADLRMLAAEALTRILDDDSGLAANWLDPADASRWLTTLNRIRTVLAPPPASADVPLFDIDS
ncbi:hypothetical protein SBI_08716 [Streptomyces bingchenggensis BCW-1]|uniref:DUF4259 domain-containing protein n=1 Tax=Streptomyces bingchenggensis (strain BCW-1) TaxID=749414 RepID=D7BWC4_STRBB|nr:MULTISPECIES: DUF4259 domain-containing protein [Streptomyces]ADI11834.1 hypothetical protein SBI_08716 [Streptomyces bingchenggensis BCW-1]